MKKHAVRFLFLVSLLPMCGAVMSGSGHSKALIDGLDYSRINFQAAKEYIEPIRPGYEGRNPFWNTFSKKFIYAPAFDFSKIDGAANYKFTIRPVEQENGAFWSFTSDSPKTALSQIWNDIPVGRMKLVVEALDDRGKTMALAGEREFLRDFPFEGPYNVAARPYKEAARMALVGIHTLPHVQYWLKNTTPDLDYAHNCYPCKIIGATVRLEVLLAKEVPLYKDEALTIAKNAAQFLMDQSRPADAPLAFFPPTYYGNKIKPARDPQNKGKTMTMEATRAGMAFLDLYDLTGEKKYYDHAIGIADTYVRMQAADGSLPIKVDIYTGEPVNEVRAMLHPLLRYFQRLENNYGVTTYNKARVKAEKWMQEVAVNTFDMTGQFEDVHVTGLRAYQNLTNSSAAPYASYLLKKKTLTPGELKDARDLIRLGEDQFVHWNYLPDYKKGFRIRFSPCVHEQYKYEVPVDSSACNMANAYLDAWKATGDPVHLAKATALINSITNAQQVTNGIIPTTWNYRTGKAKGERTFWINCSLSSIETLLRMDALVRRNSE